jgi:hypothetical protein
MLHRSPLAKIITGVLRTPDAARPRTDGLPACIARLKRAHRTLRSPHAAEQRGSHKHHRRLRQPHPGTQPAERRTQRGEHHPARGSPPGRGTVA